MYTHPEHTDFRHTRIRRIHKARVHNVGFAASQGRVHEALMCAFQPLGPQNNQDSISKALWPTVGGIVSLKIM